MRKSQFNHTRIASILKEFEQGKTADEINREYGVSKATFYKWRERYGGMEASELKRIKELEEEHLCSTGQPTRKMSPTNL